MIQDPFIELIAKQSMARLDEMERDLREQLERIKFELVIVAGAKAVKGANRKPTADRIVVDSFAGAGTSAVAAQRQRGQRSSKREPIKRVMQTAPDREWRPGEVARALDKQGIKLSRDGTRVTMNRMVEENELLKLGEGGGYMLPSSNGSASDTVSPAAPASANGENREMVLGNGSPYGTG